MNEQKPRTHYYLLNNVRYDSMRELREKFDIQTRFFKALVSKGIVIKVNTGVNSDTQNHQGNEYKKKA